MKHAMATICSTKRKALNIKASRKSKISGNCQVGLKQYTNLQAGTLKGCRI
jgi:hypothetical protein